MSDPLHPSLGDQIIELLAPQQPSEGLARDIALLCSCLQWDALSIEVVRLRLTRCEDRFRTGNVNHWWFRIGLVFCPHL